MQDYIETPIKIPLSGGKDIVKTMSKTTSTEQPKAVKKYAKTRGEHVKDMLIVALVSSIIAFIGGMHFSNQQHSQTAQAVKNAQVTAAEVKK